jgi:hypothetical protein
MANAVYATALAAFGSAGINWVSDTIKVVLVDVADYTVNLTTHAFLSDIAAGGRVSTGTLASKTNTLGVLDAADTVLTAVTGDPSEAVVVYKDTGTATTSQLICYIDTATGLPVTPNGGDITLTWDNGANKIMKI